MRYYINRIHGKWKFEFSLLFASNFASAIINAEVVERNLNVRYCVHLIAFTRLELQAGQVGSAVWELLQYSGLHLSHAFDLLHKHFPVYSVH